MRPPLPLLLGWLLAWSPVPAASLATLVQPDGSKVALGEDGSGGQRTLLFPRLSVPQNSWLLLPEGSSVVSVETVSPGATRRLSFPSVRIPGMRYAFEVPAGLLSVSVQGRLGTAMVQRSATPPPAGSWIVRSTTETRVDLPPWTTAEGWVSYLAVTRPVEAPWQVRLSDGDQVRAFRMAPSVLRWDYAPDAWNLRPTSLVVRATDPRVSEVSVRAVPASASLPADPPTLLEWPVSRWRSPEREWFHWSGTSVLVLVSADYEIQDRYLKRLAFFVEKEGYRGRLVTDGEVSHLHAWNAHDYAAPDLARFFTSAAQQDFPLHPEELELRDHLVEEGILLKASETTWKAGTGALLGISAESPPALRSVLFVHEAFHGLYFTTPAFREGVKRAWEGITEPSRAAFRSFLSLSRYDPSDEALMVNEFQSYVLQRPAAEWEGFFRDRVLADFRGARRLNALVEYLAAARALDELVQSLFGFPSGNVSAITLVSGT